MTVLLFTLSLGACGGGDDGPRSSTRVLPITSDSSTNTPTTNTPATNTPATSSQPTQSQPTQGQSPTAGSPGVPSIPLADLTIVLEPVIELRQPIDLVGRPGDDALYIAEKGGRVHRLEPGADQTTVALDLSSRVSGGGEQGLLAIAFTPDGDRLVASYTDLDGASVLASWSTTGDSGINTSDEQRHLRVEQPFGNHNGGDIAFGPDGYLYLGLGDGGSGGDPLDSGQDTTTLLGAILRIELTEDGYEPAPDNPLSEPDRPEIWLWGLRNPWRFSFDRNSGDMWIGDVGQSTQEEITYVPVSNTQRNLGWNRLEGTSTFNAEPPADHLAPLVTYGRDDGFSVTGGFVSRGDDPVLDGVYFYADFGGWVRALRQVDGEVVEHAEVLTDVGSISAFGEDNDGRLYVITLDGPIYRLGRDR